MADVVGKIWVLAEDYNNLAKGLLHDPNDMGTVYKAMLLSSEYVFNATAQRTHNEYVAHFKDFELADEDYEAITLTNLAMTLSGDGYYIDADDLVFTGTLTAPRWLLICDCTAASEDDWYGRAILDFRQTLPIVNGQLTITWNDAVVPGIWVAGVTPYA